MDVIQLNIREVLIIISAFASMIVLFGAGLLKQFEKRMSERLDAQAEIREKEAGYRNERLGAVESSLAGADHRIAGLSRKIDALREDLPRQYVTREDWIRSAAATDAKLDRLLEVILQGRRMS